MRTLQHIIVHVLSEHLKVAPLHGQLFFQPRHLLRTLRLHVSTHPPRVVVHVAVHARELAPQEVQLGDHSQAAIANLKAGQENAVERFVGDLKYFSKRFWTLQFWMLLFGRSTVCTELVCLRQELQLGDNSQAAIPDLKGRHGNRGSGVC